MFKKLNILKKLVLSSSLTAFLVLTTITVYFIMMMSDKLSEAYQKEVSSLSNNLAMGVKLAIQNGDWETVEKVVNNSLSDPRTEFIVIYSDGEPLIEKTKGVKYNKSMLTNSANVIKNTKIELTDFKGEVFLSMNKKDMNATLNGAIIFSIIISLVMLGITILGSYLMAKRISTPIIEVKNAAEQISLGNLDINLTTNNQDETGDLCTSILKMKTTLKNIVEIEVESLLKAAKEGHLEYQVDCSNYSGSFYNIVNGFNETLQVISEPLSETEEVLKAYANGDFRPTMKGVYSGKYSDLKNYVNILGDSLNDIMLSLTGAVETIVTTTDKLNNASHQLATSSHEQSSEADQVANQVDQMVITINENARNSSKTAETAEQNGKIAKDGGDVVHKTVNKMKEIAQVVSTTANNINKLGESSKEIGEIIAVIEEIADQTNLLALNAAIEAARAGESGRGFAVVADEVRKLAERTSEATKQISQMVQGIQKDTESAVVAMVKGNEEVSEGIELADNAGLALNQILNSSDQVMHMIAQIAAANEEQSSTSAIIANSVSTISRYTDVTAKQVNNLAGSVNDMFSLSKQIEDLVKRFEFNYNGNSKPNRNSNNNYIENGSNYESKYRRLEEANS